MHKALALILLAMAPAATPSPTEVVKTGIEQVVQAVQDFDASHPAAAEKRRLEIRRAAGRLFDFEEMAKLVRALEVAAVEQRAGRLELLLRLLEVLARELIPQLGHI